MKLIRYKKNGNIGRAIVEQNEVFALKGDLFADFTKGEKIADLTDIKLLEPIIPPNIIAIGLNYKHHAMEMKSKIPKKPVVFLKATSSITGPNTEIKLPKQAAEEVDYEAELAVIIGKRAKNIESLDAEDYILGYSCANDISARDCQKRLDKQWARGKSFDTFCPLGPWIETELDPSNLAISSKINGEIRQDSRTSDMIFDVNQLVSYLSHNMTLLPGTVILTGTPAGVAMGTEENSYLREGDQVSIKIEGIGTLTNTVSKEI